MENLANKELALKLLTSLESKQPYLIFSHAEEHPLLKSLLTRDRAGHSRAGETACTFIASMLSQSVTEGLSFPDRLLCLTYTLAEFEITDLLSFILYGRDDCEELISRCLLFKKYLPIAINVGDVFGAALTREEDLIDLVTVLEDDEFESLLKVCSVSVHSNGLTAAEIDRAKAIDFHGIQGQLIRDCRAFVVENIGMVDEELLSELREFRARRFCEYLLSLDPNHKIEKGLFFGTILTGKEDMVRADHGNHRRPGDGGSLKEDLDGMHSQVHHSPGDDHL